MKKKTFSVQFDARALVTCSVDVEAENEEEAKELAKGLLNENDWEFAGMLRDDLESAVVNAVFEK